MDDFFSPAPTNGTDPASEFLRREQAALGHDASSFNESTLNSLTDQPDFERSASAFPDLENGDDVFDSQSNSPIIAAPRGGGAGAGVGGDHVSVTGNNEFSAFESQFPAVEVSPVVSYQNNGFTAPSYDQPASLFSGTPVPREADSDAIKAWRVKQAGEIAEREAASLRKKEETITRAQVAIDNFYKEYNAKKAKNIARNKEEEAELDAARTDALAKGTTWDRICTLIDLNDSRSKSSSQSTQDLSRFREILLSLRKEGDTAPGAKGY